MHLAFVMMNVDTGKEAEVLNELNRIEHVKEAYLTYGVYDVAAKIEANTSDELKDVIFKKVRRLKNVKATLTMMVVE
jgi:DNA-binding Lrp family transcriptional regulator